MSNCNNDCENCKIEDFCGYSVDTLGYAEFSRVVEEHDKQIRNDAIDECIKIVENGKWNYSIIAKLEQLKEKKNE